MQTLADKHAPHIETLRKGGYHSIAEMAQHFRQQTEMGKAIGFSATAVCGWLGGKHAPTHTAEAAARHWLSQTVQQAAKPAPAAPAAPPLISAPPAPAPTEDVVLMIVAPPAIADKAKRLLAALRCEVIEV